MIKMSYIDLDCSSFASPLDTINGHHHVSCSKLTLTLACMSAGYGTFWASIRQQNGIRRLSYISGIIGYFFMQSKHDILPSAAYFAVDDSERRNASYYFGQGCAKIFATSKLTAPITYHVDGNRFPVTQQPPVLKRPTTIDPRRKRPDLIAFAADLGTVHVIECKGRSSNTYGVPRRIMNAAISEGLVQVACVGLVNNMLPSTRCACAAGIFLNGLEMLAEDPPSGNGVDLAVSTTDILRSNYSYFFRRDMHLKKDVLTNHLMVDLENGYYYGIHEDVYDVLNATLPEAGQLAISLRGRENFSDGRIALGADGTAIYVKSGG